MADQKKYLDDAGVKYLKEYIMQHYLSLQQAIDEIYETPSSIQGLIDQAIQNIDIADLQQENTICLYGGSASEVFENKEAE